MYSQGNLDVQQFAGYAQNLVRYYNTGGFTAPDGPHVSPSNHPITWWGIYNEPNIPSNNIPDPSAYTSMYNSVVPAMQQIDPAIKFVAVELSGGYNNWEQIYFSNFVQNVTAQVDVVPITSTPPAISRTPTSSFLTPSQDSPPMYRRFITGWGQTQPWPMSQSGSLKTTSTRISTSAAG